MSVALLISASPKRSSGGPIVRLREGYHTIHIHGQIDSVLFMNVGGVNLDLWNGCELRLPTSSDVQVLFGKRGTEEAIDVFAQRQM